MINRARRTLLGMLLPLLSLAVTYGQENRASLPPLQPAATLERSYTALAADSLRLKVDQVFTVPEQTREMPVTRGGFDVTETRQSGGVFPLWRDAAVGAYGGTDHMPGLMDRSTGALTLHQDFGRLHLSLSANANKYWLPMQSSLFTQYGVGGHASIDVNHWLSLHAFGNFYFSNMRATPAVSPYAYSTSFGGYADIRFSDHWGTYLGARHYLNPMNGRWETDPIVTPYYKFNNGAKIELPIGPIIGDVLRRAVWGEPQPPLMMRPVPPRP
ncbi:MAG: hypothetical protein IJP46_08520 [Prevotella sp.]|nr:hypothetical protein [Prevotella sp.]